MIVANGARLDSLQKQRLYWRQAAYSNEILRSRKVSPYHSVGVAATVRGLHVLSWSLVESHLLVVRDVSKLDCKD